MCDEEGEELSTINIMNSQTTSSDANTPGAVIIVRVAVGSSNPCKVESVRRAFTEVFNAAAAARTTTTARREVQIVISTYNVSSGKIWERGGISITTCWLKIAHILFFISFCKYTKVYQSNQLEIRRQDVVQ